MIKPITITPKQWEQLQKEIFNDQPLSVRASRRKMREILGFTNRIDRNWNWKGDEYINFDTERVVLDFFDEKKKTMFILKYSHIID